MISRLFNASGFAFVFFFAFIRIEKQYSSRVNQVLIKNIFDTSWIQVNPVSYGQSNWEYWGFTNDWVQQEAIHDLNAYYHKKNIHFITEEEAKLKNVKIDKIIEISFPNIQIGQLKETRSSDQRTAKVIIGYMNTASEKPVYQTVSAVISYAMTYVDNNAILQCRIYNLAKDTSFMFDNFEGKYQWTNTTATYTGNEVALTENDWTVINNSYKNVPSKNELAQKLVRICYNDLITKITNKIRF